MHARTSLRLAALAALAAFALAACTPASPANTPAVTSPGSGSPAASADPAPDGPMAAADPAEAPAQLQFSTTTLDGQPFDGTSLYGQPTVLYFWASWCPICQSEAPGISAALKELPDGVQAIGIPGRSDTASMQKFVDTYGLGDMTQLVDESGTLWANFQVASQPALVTIAADGTVTSFPSTGKAGILEAAASIAP